MLVGGALFERVAGGVRFLPRGKLVLAHARKLLDANDQILSIGGAVADYRPLRIGLSTLFAPDYLARLRTTAQTELASYYCGKSSEIAKMLSDGAIDLACIMEARPERGETLIEWDEEFVWVRSRDFVLSHGSPVPLVGTPGDGADVVVMDAMEKSGLAYRIAFTSHDFKARLSAVAAGIGVMGLPVRHVAEPLIRAREYYLPKIRSYKAYAVARHGIDSRRLVGALQIIQSLPGTNAPTAALEAPADESAASGR
jgi:DNA-binding transcriptional LysR family regulator